MDEHNLNGAPGQPGKGFRSVSAVICDGFLSSGRFKNFL